MTFEHFKIVIFYYHVILFDIQIKINHFLLTNFIWSLTNFTFFTGPKCDNSLCSI